MHGLNGIRRSATAALIIWFSTLWALRTVAAELSVDIRATHALTHPHKPRGPELGNHVRPENPFEAFAAGPSQIDLAREPGVCPFTNGHSAFGRVGPEPAVAVDYDLAAEAPGIGKPGEAAACWRPSAP